MTITDLVANFRKGLLGLLPSVEYVGIAWKRPGAYDEWDNLATAVYEALVVEPLRSTLPEGAQESFVLAAYDMLSSSYSGKMVIEVLPRLPTGMIRVFHALGTERDPFDVVEWRAVLANGTPVSDALERIPLNSATFALTCRLPETLTEPHPS